ncbi:MAG: hypothetical protein MZV64_58670 [Ignavibacteriales bacterium]|nr:hypothetical protein [Ignavibacteriales bacterium]
MKKILIFLALSTTLVFSQNEFRVNTFTDTTQRWASVDKDGNGNYYVVWQSINWLSSVSPFQIVLQQFNSSDQKVGGEVLVNGATTYKQEKPTIATNSSGKVLLFGLQ